MTTCYKLVSEECFCIYCERDRRVNRLLAGETTDADRAYFKRTYQTEKNVKKTLLGAAVAVLMAMSACAPVPAHHGRPHHHKVAKVIHTSDGRYAYQDNHMIWWWYFMSTQNAPTSAAAATTTSSGMASIPAGGAWVQGAAPSSTQMAGAVEEEVELDVMAEGEPAVEAPSEAAAEAGEGADAGAGASDSGAGASSDGGSSGGGDGGGGGGDGGGD